MNISLIVSFAIHILVVAVSCFSFGNMFHKNIPKPSHTVFDFVTIAPKSKAPVLSKNDATASASPAPSQAQLENKKNMKNIVHSSAKKEVEPIPLSKPKKEIQKSADKSKKSDEKAISIQGQKKKVTQSDVKKKALAPKKAQDIQKSSSPKKAPDTKKAPAASKKVVVNLAKEKNITLAEKNAKKTQIKKSFNSALDSAINAGSGSVGANAEEVGEILTSTQIDMIKQRMQKCWHFPAGLKDAVNLIVDIKIELDKNGNVVSAEIINSARMNTDADFKIAAESAYRAVWDPVFTPLPLPLEKYNEWKQLELCFDPKDILI